MAIITMMAITSTSMTTIIPLFVSCLTLFLLYGSPYIYITFKIFDTSFNTVINMVIKIVVISMVIIMVIIVVIIILFLTLANKVPPST